MTMETTSLYKRRPAVIFITFLSVLWLGFVGLHVAGFRLFSPNLERAEDRQAYGGSGYTHK